MNKLLRLEAAVFAAALLALPMAHGAAMTNADYDAAKARISATHQAHKDACKALTANARDICLEEAKGKEKVARAELEHARSGKADDQRKLLVARADAAHDVAREKCDDMKGNERDLCIKQAEATRTKALADVKLGQKVSEARKDAAEEKRDADHKVAIEKCDALAGDAKAACVAAAKARFGKS